MTAASGQPHQSGQPGPLGLDDFWAGTRDALRAVPADVVVTKGESPAPGAELRWVSFASLGGVRIRGYALAHRDGRPRPLVVHAHGYRSQTTPQLAWLHAGCNVVGIDIRGFGRSADAVPRLHPWGWLLTGVRDPNTSVLRGAVCDYVRATELAAGIVDQPVARLVVHGVSLAGGLATMAEAVCPGADLLVLGVPTFGWTEGRRLLVERGSGAEVSSFLDDHPEFPEDDLQLVLAHFDAATLACGVRCATIAGVGRVDRVVPAPTVRAVIANLAGPTEVMEFPVSHDAGPLMRRWDAFDDRWLSLAVDGVPADFGRQVAAAASATQAR